MKKQSINREIDQNTDFGFTYYPLDKDGNKLSSNEIALQNVTAYCSVKKYPSSSTSINLQTSIGSDNQSHIFVKVYAAASQTVTFKEGTWFYDVIVDIGDPYTRSKVLEGLIFVYPSVSNTNSFISAVQNDFAAVLNSGNRIDISTYTRLIRSPFQSGYFSPEARSTDSAEYDDESQRKMQRCCDIQNYWMNFIKSWSPEKWVNDGNDNLSITEKFLEALRIKYTIDRYLKRLLEYQVRRYNERPILIPLPAWLKDDWPLRLPQFPPVGPSYWPDELIPFKPVPYIPSLEDGPGADDLRPLSWYWPWQDAFNPNQPSILDIFPGGIPKLILEDLLILKLTCQKDLSKFWDLMLRDDCTCTENEYIEGSYVSPAPCKYEFQRLIDTLTDPSFNANSFDPEETDCCTSFGFMAPIFSLLNCLITRANGVPCLFGCDEERGLSPGQSIDPGGFWWDDSYECTTDLGKFLNALRRDILVGWLYCQFECAKRGYGDAGGPCGCLPKCDILPPDPNDPDPPNLRDIEDIIDPPQDRPGTQPESWHEIYRNCPGLLRNPYGGVPYGDGENPYPPGELPVYPEEGFPSWNPLNREFRKPIEEFNSLCGSYFSSPSITFETKMCCDCVRDLIPTCADPVPPAGGWPEGYQPEPCTPSWDDPIAALCVSVLNLLTADISGFTIDPDTAIPGGTPINLDLLNKSCGSGPTIPPKPPRDVGEPESEGITPSALRQKCKDLSATYLMEVLSWIQCILDYLERNHPNQHDDKKKKLEDLIRKIQICMVSCTNS